MNSLRFHYIISLAKVREINQRMNNLIKLLDNNLEYIELELIDDTIYISLKSIKEYVCCPYCCAPSNKVHSRYKRSFQDLPIQGLKVIVKKQ